MADMYPVNGTRIYIGGAMALPSADVVAADFDSVSFVEIDGYKTMGKIGDASALITSPLINRKRDLKQKGTKNAGQMANVFNVIADDAGQIALIAAEASVSNFPFKLVFDDAPEGGTATVKYLIGLVMDVSEAGGGANTDRTMNGTIEINSNVVTVPAAA